MIEKVHYFQARGALLMYIKDDGREKQKNKNLYLSYQLCDLLTQPPIKKVLIKNGRNPRMCQYIRISLQHRLIRKWPMPEINLIYWLFKNGT